ncbi:gliding motility-associated C-terminal domain-containing protein [bacterium]|nr:gliding motility-associated C-terminal domain-containing protein [bacterium]
MIIAGHSDLKAQAYICWSDVCASLDTSLGGYPGEGHFGIGHRDGTRLTYAYSPTIVPWEPGESETHFVLRVNDFRFTNWPTYFTFCGGTDIRDFPMTHSFTDDPPEVVTTWQVREAGSFPRYDFTLRQVLTPMIFEELPQVRIEYFITNNLGERIDVGLILFIDVRIGGMDRPQMELGPTVVDTGSVWYYPYIPYYYRGYESRSDPAALVAKGYLREGDCTPPDVFAVGQASGLSHVCWEIGSAELTAMRYGLPYYDVGVFMRWDLMALMPGLSRSFITYYGIGDSLKLVPGLTLTPGDVSFDVVDCDIALCKQANATATNNDEELRDYDSVQICIKLPEGRPYYLDSLPPYTNDTCLYTTPDSFPPGGFGAAGWNICLSDPDYCTGPDNPDTIYWTGSVVTPPDVEPADTFSLIYVDCFTGIHPEIEILNWGTVSCTTDLDSLIRFNITDDESVNYRATRATIWDDDDSLIITRFSDPTWRLDPPEHKMPIPDIFLDEHCKEIHFRVDSAVDVNGCVVLYRPEVVFMTDFVPPYAKIISPPCDSVTLPVLSDPLPEFQIFMADTPCGAIDPTSLEIIINGTDYGYVDGVWEPDDSIFHLYPRVPVISGDTNEVCIVYLQDSVDFCEPNVFTDTTCCYYWADFDPPEAEILYPPSGITTACSCETVIVTFQDPSGIDWSSVEVRIGDATLSCTHPAVTCRNDSFIYVGCDFDECTWIFIEVIYVTDSLGNALMAGIVEDSFFTDHEGPYIFYGPGSPEPNGVFVSPIGLTWQVGIVEECTILDTTELRLRIRNINTGEVCEYYHYSDPIRWGPIDDPGFPRWLYFDFFVDTCISLNHGDTLEVCLLAIADNAQKCGPNYNDSIYCWKFSIDATYPEAYLLYPDLGQHTTCTCQEVEIKLFDNTGIDLSTIRLLVDERVYRYGSDEELSYNPSDSILRFTCFGDTPRNYESCSRIDVVLLQAQDSLGNNVPTDTTYDWWFIMDHQGPWVQSMEPGEGSPDTSAFPLIKIAIFDSCSWLTPDGTLLELILTKAGIPPRTVITVDLTWPDPALSWFSGNPGTLYVDIGAIDTFAAVRFEDQDTIEYCLHDFTDDVDIYDCPLNHLENDTCTWFYRSSEGPQVYNIDPYRGCCVSCTNYCITMEVVDDIGIDTTTIEFTYESTPYYIGDPELTYDTSTSILTFCPSTPFTHCDTVNFCLQAVSNMLGTPMRSPVCGSFRVDLNSPGGSNPAPGVDYIIVNPTPIVRLDLDDDCCGILASSICFEINVTGTDIWSATYCIDTDTSVVFTGGTARWDPTLVPVEFRGGNFVHVCVAAADNVDPSYCAPNTMEYCWDFALAASGPVASTIYPSDSQVVACPTIDTLLIEILDAEGVVPDAITLSIESACLTDVFEYGTDPELVFSGDTLFFIPSPPLEAAACECTIRVEMSGAEDILGNPGNILSYYFILDNSAPVITYVDIADRTIGTTDPTLGWELEDRCNVVDGDAFYVVTTKNSTIVDTFEIWTADSVYFEWIPDRLEFSGWDLLIGGDSVYYCLHAFDLVDVCEPNEADTCCWFKIEGGGPIVSLLAPATDGDTIGNSCLPYTYNFSIRDTNGVDETTIEVLVSYCGGDVVYTIADDEVDFHDGSLLDFTPDLPFCDCDPISISIQSADDALGNPVVENEFSFLIDRQAPIVELHSPSYSETTVDSMWQQCPVVRWRVTDSCAGLIDTNCISARVFNSYRDSIFNWDDGNFSWELDTLTGDTLLVFRSGSGFCFDRYETVHVCLLDLCDDLDTCENHIEFDSTELCWWWIVAQGGPMCELISPEDDGVQICNDQCVYIRLWDDDDINLSSVRVNINDSIYPISPPTVTWIAPETIIVCPDPAWDNEIVRINIESAEDTLGYTLATDCDFPFYIDLHGPIADYPGPWTVGHFPVCSLYIWDYPHPAFGTPMNEIDSTTIVVMVDGVRYHVGAPILNYYRAGSLLVFNGVAAGDTFLAGEIIEICVDSAWDITGCPENNFLDSIFCWEVVAETTAGPALTLLQPPFDGATFSCDSNFTTRIWVDDPEGIIWDSTYVDVTSPSFTTTYTWGVLELAVLGDSLEVEIDPAVFSLAHGEPLDIEITKLIDRLGNPYTPPGMWTFYMDTLPPGIIARSPLCGGVVYSIRPTIWFIISDLDTFGIDSDVDTTSPVISINGHLFRWGDPNMWWHGDTLFYFTGDSVTFIGGEPIEYCLEDIADIPDLCEPNHLQEALCCTFYLGAGGPIAEMIRPQPGSIISCYPQQVIIEIIDSIPGGVVESTIVLEVGMDTYNYPSTNLSWTPIPDAGGRLTFTPPIPFENGDVVTVHLAEAMDSAYNPLDTTYSTYIWTFTVDLSPPVGSEFNPPDGSIVFDWQQDISLRIIDSIGVVDTNCFELCVDDYGCWDLTHPGLSWYPADSMLYFYPESAGIFWQEFDVICPEVTVCDAPDTCDPNMDTITWCFYIGDDDTIPPYWNCMPCSVYAESTFRIQIELFDDLSGIFDDESGLAGQGIVLGYNVGGTVDIPTGDTIGTVQMTLQPDGRTAISELIGPFAAGVEVVYQVRVCDNDTDFSYYSDRECTYAGPCTCIVVESQKPDWSIIMPNDDEYYSCCDPDPQEVTVWVYDANGIIESSCTLSVNGTRHVPPRDLSIGYNPVTYYLTYTPEIPWTNGEVVCCSLWGVRDNLLNPVADTLNWCFTMDCVPPIIYEFGSEDCEFLYPDEVGNIEIVIEDELCGVVREETQIRVTVGDDEWTYGGEDPPNYYRGDTLIFPVPVTDVDYESGDTIHICVLRACDCAIGCGPNCTLDTSCACIFIMPTTECDVEPNPFTPNGDGYNDEAVFDFPKRFERDGEINIFDIKGKHIRKLESDHYNYIWDGLDDNGQACRQGTYIYIVKSEGKEVCSGTVILAR